MDAYLLKMAVKNAAKEALAENELRAGARAELNRNWNGSSSPAAESYYRETMKKINELPEGDDKRGLLSWMKDFLKAAPSIQGDLARGVDAVLKELKKKKR